MCVVNSPANTKSETALGDGWTPKHVNHAGGG